MCSLRHLACAPQAARAKRVSSLARRILSMTCSCVHLLCCVLACGFEGWSFSWRPGCEPGLCGTVVQQKIAEAQGRAIRERKVEDPAGFLSRLGCATAVKDMVRREDRDVRFLDLVPVKLGVSLHKRERSSSVVTAGPGR
jgi:hypothetical protein